MATGKSTVGRRLAKHLGRPFVDTDQLVETQAGKKVTEIFANEGEAGFRARERQAVAAACAQSDAVIAIGGGALGDPESHRMLQAAGPIICLEATPEEILRRVGDARTRPLLATAPDRLARIRELLAARDATYRLATHRVDTTRVSIDTVVARVAALIEAAE